MQESTKQSQLQETTPREEVVYDNLSDTSMKT